MLEYTYLKMKLYFIKHHKIDLIFLNNDFIIYEFNSRTTKCP